MRETALNSRRQLLIWVIAAVAASSLLAAVLLWQHKAAHMRWGAFLSGSPHKGAQLFEIKGCVHCHSVNGWGGHLALDLGFERPPRSNLNQLVSAMWNCAPRMWERIRTERITYPALDEEDMAHLFAFLYTARYLDEPGDSYRGRQLFTTKRCISCHALRGEGGRKGPDLAAVGGVDTPIVWAQAMWNHAPAMAATMEELGYTWPRFEGSEMNDLLAYIREVTDGPRHEAQMLPADPERGWKLFQSKSCLQCHSVNASGAHVGPELGPGRRLPPTLVQFAGLMWNHSPKMWQEMQAKGIPRPIFEGRQMADLVAFLYSLRYFEPGGSPEAGEKLFSGHECHRCHGSRAEGGPKGPALRKRGEIFTSVHLAAGLWMHGPKMLQATKELGIPWPVLRESEVGDLVSFLNTPLEAKR